MVFLHGLPTTKALPGMQEEKEGKEGTETNMNQVQRGLFLVLTLIAMFLLANLFVLATKDHWHEFGETGTFGAVVFFVTLPLTFLGFTCFGIWLERNRPRERIDNVVIYKKRKAR